jgi:hypothetical protein
VKEKTNRDEGHSQPEQNCRPLKKPIHDAKDAPPLLSLIEGKIKDGLSSDGLIVLCVGNQDRKGRNT